MRLATISEPTGSLMTYAKLLIASSFFLVVTLGCGSDEVDDISELCPGSECVECSDDADCEVPTQCHEEGVCVVVSCDDHQDCGDGSYCDSDDEICAAAVCEPGTSRCEGESVAYCTDVGSGFEEPQACDYGACEDGQCRCTEAGDCAQGEECDGGECVCPSEISCGDDGICCAEDEVCADTEICDGDDCQTIFQCRPACAGSFCGFDSELCCEGDTPECGPTGECAPDCEGQGELCGEDFNQCCEAGDVCVFGTCRTPGEPCEVFSDCDFGEYCDEGLGKCMVDDFPDDLVCEDDIDFDPFDIEQLWHWDGVEVGNNTYQNVQSIPVTAEIIQNGTPEIVITPYHGSDQHNGILAVVSGVTGETVYHNAERTFSGQGHSAVADVTGDGLPEIVSILGEGDEGVAMVENPMNCMNPEQDDDDCIRWEVRSGTVDRYSQGMGPLIADINQDGNAEVVVGTIVIDADSGEVVADGTSSSRGHNGLGNWGASAVADLDGDGSLELLTGDCAWKVDFEEGELVEHWCNDEFSNGIPAVADIVHSGERAGKPEVAVVRSGVLRILDGDTGETLYAIDVPGGGDGGPPNIADFDGDGTVEIGLPGAQCYSVFDIACVDDSDEPGECDQPDFPDCTSGEDCIVDPCDDSALSDGSGDGVLWSIDVHDGSMTTGSSVFDFQGNERNEVVYNDECRLLVLDGQSGQPLISRINTTRTATEYPLVVDVNGDGRSNIAVIANNDQYDRDCEDFLTPGHENSRPDWFPECYPDDLDERPEACDEGTSGVFAFQDLNDAWVSTRAIWNQHAYHITNIEDDATLPDAWEPPWEQFNTFRANRQGEVPLNAPDVAVTSVQVNALQCPPDIDFRVTVQNLGISAIPAGLPVSFYLFEPGSDGVLVTTETIDEPISPGGMATVDYSHEIDMTLLNTPFDFQIVANDDGDDGEPVRDCNPDNAMAMVEDLMCFIEI